MSALSRLNEQLFSTTAEMHAAQDAVTLALLVLLSCAYPKTLMWVFGAVGLSAAGKTPRKMLLRHVDEFVRVDDIENNLEYFLVPFVVVLGIGAAVVVGLGLATLPV